MADGPLTNFANLRGRVDANGYLLVTISGGTVTADKIVLDKTNADIVLWRQAAKTLQIDSDGASGVLTKVILRASQLDVGSVNGADLLLSGAGTLTYNTRVVFNTPASAQYVMTNAAQTAGVAFDFATNGTLKLRGTALTAGTGNLDIGAKISAYNAITTVANGVPSIYGSGAVAATTGAIASLATYTVGAANAEFEIAGHVDVNTATTHAFTMVANYTDPAGVTRAQTLSFTLVAGGALVTVVTAASGTVPYNGVPVRIRAKQTTAITVITTGTLTTVNYDANASIMQIN